MVTKIVIIGTSGTVDRAVTQASSRKHEVARMGCTQGDHQVDITSQESVEALSEKAGRADVIVSATGNLSLGPLSIMTDQDFNQGLQDKLLGQIHLALTGQHLPNSGGSITLTSGIIAHEPIIRRANAVMIDARPEGFVRAAACELGHSQHISLINSTMLSEFVEAYDSFFPGFESVPVTTVANAYRCSVEGIQTGRIYKVGY